MNAITDLSKAFTSTTPTITGWHFPDDTAALNTWLGLYANKNTFRLYQREVERLVMFMRLHDNLTLKNVSPEHIQAYVQFLAQPPADLVGPARSRESGMWKPFTGSMTRGSIRHAVSIIGMLFKWLKQCGHVAFDPVRAGVRVPALGRFEARSDSYFTGAQFGKLIDALRKVGEGTRAGGDAWRYERNRYLFLMLFYTGLRREEASKALMGDITYVEDGEAQHWVLNVLGKGSKQAQIVLSDGALLALARLRRYMGLPDMPVLGELTPLVPLENSVKSSALSYNGMYQGLKSLMKRALEFIPPEETQLRKRVSEASPHWLRHTFVTALTNAEGDISRTSIVARHDNINTTMGYRGTDIAQRAETMNKLLPDFAR